ncbi:MAG: hypothetical protein QM791_10980 [Ferruginibacter sp.]
MKIQSNKTSAPGKVINAVSNFFNRPFRQTKNQFTETIYFLRKELTPSEKPEMVTADKNAH